MFEQSLYEPKPVTTTSAAGPDLFKNYEVVSWNMSGRIYKILAISAVANILAILVVAQTSMLTMKGCESPLVGRVCQVLDTVYVGTLLFGTDRDYVDQAYEKTELADADITFVDVSGVTPPLSYPEGYFQIANPNEFQAMLDQANNPAFDSSLSGFPDFSTTMPQTGGSLTDTPPIIPKSNPNILDGELPTFGGGGSSVSPNPVKTPRRKPVKPPVNSNDVDDLAQVEKTPDPVETKPTPEKTVDPTAPVDSYDINKRPFVDLATNVNDLLDKKQVNLASAFVVNAAGKLTKEGKLDPKTFRWGQVASEDQKMIDVVKEAITAINDSGYLQYLKDISGKDFVLQLKQDESTISAVVQSEMETDTRAKSIKSGLDLAIGIAKLKKQAENADQNDKDDLILLENAKIETDGKKIILKFLVPKEIALPMIQRKLAEQKAEPKQPNGNTNGQTVKTSAQK